MLINLVLCAAINKLPLLSSEEKGIVFQACNSAVSDYRRGGAGGGVVLMGSSLMMTPIWSQDVRWFPNVADVYHHHLSLSFERLLSSRGLRTKVFNFALPGAMVSDVYLLSRKLFRDDRTPSLVVYGIGPRDFMDDLLTGETRTAVFQKLSDLSDLTGSGDLYFSSFEEKADFALNNAIFLYGKRCRYQDKLSQTVNKLYDRLGKVATSVVGRQAGANLDAASLADRQGLWRKSIEEYRARYRRFNQKQFEKQCDFLRAFLKTAQERHFKVVLANMPLTADNLHLMPPGFYEHYRATVASLARAYGVPLLDLQGDRHYNDLCFYDTVHLNADGGQRLLTGLADWLSCERPLSGRLAGAGRSTQ